MTLELESLKLNIIRFDLTSPVLYFGQEYSHTLRIEQVFHIIKTNQKIKVYREIKQDNIHVEFHGANELLNLLGSKVKSATAEQDGSLTIDFDSGQIINVEPDLQYEAWTFTTPKGTLVSLPGGGLG